MAVTIIPEHQNLGLHNALPPFLWQRDSRVCRRVPQTFRNSSRVPHGQGAKR